MNELLTASAQSRSANDKWLMSCQRDRMEIWVLENREKDKDIGIDFWGWQCKPPGLSPYRMAEIKARMARNLGII